MSMSPVMRYHNAALKYYLALTESPYLHYGYWESAPAQDELTLPNFRVAQKHYAEKLFGFIPETIQTILDVGCGVGGNAKNLLDQGFDVDGLAPDPFQQDKFLATTQDRAIFHLSRFEDFTSKDPYDLIFLSESSQYMNMDDLAAAANKNIKAQGYLLLADMMRSDVDYKEGIFSGCHATRDVETALKAVGFTLIRCEDISAQIAPTLDLCIEKLRIYGFSTLHYIADVLEIAVPPIYLFLRWAYRKWLKATLIEGLNSRHIFDQHLCYQIQLWQLV